MRQNSTNSKTGSVNQSSKSKGKRYRSGQPKKDSKTKRINFDNERIDKFQEHMNDIAWYANNPELMRAAASISYAATTGSRLFPNAYTAVPGVMAINFIPTIGSTMNNSTPINSAAQSTYSYVVHANSRNTTYDPADLMMTILAGAQVFAAVSNVRRVYGIAKTYDQRNLYLPDMLLRALGFKGDDIRSNLADIWFTLNNWIAQTQQIWIPNTFPIIKRWIWLNSAIFQDSNSIKGQFYVFNQKDFLVYSEKTSTTGTSLKYPSISSDGSWSMGKKSTSTFSVDSKHVTTWNNYKGMVQFMIDSLIESQDRGIMMGDILKAYGEDKIFALEPVPADYQLIPEYQPEVLTQIENLTVSKHEFAAIEQNSKGNIYMLVDPSWQALPATPTDSNWHKNGSPSYQILNLHQKEYPTPEQVTIATRLKCGGLMTYKSGSNVWVFPSTFGTELVNSVHSLYYGYSASGDNTIAVNVKEIETNVTSLPSTGVDWMNWAAYDWCPWIYNWTDSATSYPSPGINYVYTVNYALGDYDNYVVLDVNTLSNINQMACLSEFNVPTL